MADKYRIDSHKLIYHVDRVKDWLENGDAYPLYAEVSPSGTCNHRCTYCGLDFMEYQPRYLKTDIFKERLTEMGRLGLKSIMYAGEGEPFLHRDMLDITEHTKASGIDVAFTTNGVLLNEKRAERVLPVTTWIKVSINGATPETYAKIHRTKPEDLERVFSNMSYAARARRKNGWDCTLGMQLMLLPENQHEAVDLARRARDIGLDYLVVKPYSQHPQSRTRMYEDIKYSDYMHLRDELEEVSGDGFSVIFRLRTMQKWDEAERNYTHCLALPFWSYIDAGGNVWGCSVFLGQDEYYYGNIYEETFEQIWQGERRKESIRRTVVERDASHCRVNCRMDEVNRYLWELRNPSGHVNFI